MGCDPSPIVRRTIIKCIGATRLTLPHVVRRTLDVDERVRRLAYKFIADKIHIKSLTIAQREEIVKRGLNDRNENVRKMVSKELVPSWLRLCNDNIIELLYALDVGNSDGETAKDVLNVLFEDVSHKELVENFCYLDPATKLVPAAKLTPETAVYWRNLTRFMYDEIEVRGVQAAAPYLETLLPELTQFCHYIRQFILEHSIHKNDVADSEECEDEEAKEVAWLFVAKQLIEMTNVFDLSDEMGRNNLAKLCREILLSRKVTTDFVDPVMRVFTVVQGSPTSRIQEIAEIIAELREPLLSRDNENRNTNDQGDEGFGDSEEDRAVDETLQSEFDAMENANKVLSKAEQVKKEEEQRKKQVAMAKVRVQINILKDDLEDAIQNQDFMKAQQIKSDMDKLDVEQNRLQDELTEAAAMAPVPSSGTKKVKEKEALAKSVATTEAKISETEAAQLDQSTVKADDPLIIHKCLKMLGVMLESNDIKSANATLQTLLDEFVVPSVQNIDCHIRNSAVKAMGGTCLRSLDAAKRHLLLILQIAHLDTPEVRITALNVIYDLLMWHGLPAFITSTADESGDNVQDDEMSNLESVLDSEQGCRLPTQKQFETHGGNSVVAILSQLLDDPDIEIRTRVAEGLCKLMMCGSISSPKLFTRLILIWYNPITEADGKLRHILGTFFPLYASFSRANQDSIEESFMPTLKTLFDAPTTSPLTDVDIDDVGAFYVQLTRADILQQSNKVNRDEDGDIATDIGASVHDAMAYTLCNQILESPDSFHVKTLIRLLLVLQITANNFVKLKELKVFHTHMMQAVRDKLCLKSLERFGMRLDEWLSKDPELEVDKEEEDKEVDADREVEPSSEKNSEEEENSNATILKKKRTLFTHNATTMLDLTRAVGNESGGETDAANSSLSKTSSQANLHMSQNPPVLKITVENSSSEEDQPKSKELKVSKVLSEINTEISLAVAGSDNKDSDAAISVKRAEISSESDQPPKKQSKIVVASSEESEDEVVSGNILRNTKPTVKKKTSKASASTYQEKDAIDVLTSTQSTTMLGQCLNQSQGAGSLKSKQASSTEELEKVISPVKRRSSSRKNVRDAKEISPVKPKKSTTASSSAPSSPSSVFPSASEDTEDEIVVTSVSNTPTKQTRQRKANADNKSPKCKVAITPNSIVTKSDLKKKYTPHTLSDKVAIQAGGKAKQNLKNALDDSRDADDDSEKDTSLTDTVELKKKLLLVGKKNMRNAKVADVTEQEEKENDQDDFINSRESSESGSANQRRGRKGKIDKPAPEKTVIEETESEDEDQPEQRNNRRGRTLRGTQSSTSVPSTLSSTTTRTRSRSSQAITDVNSSQGSDMFLSPPSKGKALQVEHGYGRVTRSVSKESLSSDSKPVTRRRNIFK